MSNAESRRPTRTAEGQIWAPPPESASLFQALNQATPERPSQIPDQSAASPDEVTHPAGSGPLL